MFTFHIAVHARSPEVSTGQEVSLNGQQFRTLNAPPAALTAPFPVTFEQAGEALSSLERLYSSPTDRSCGFLVVASPSGKSTVTF